jgi:translation elongation factor EF-Tu-like GTPase
LATDNLIIVKARISMKKTEEGGRTSGFASGYRPNHVFELPEDSRMLIAYIGDIQFDGQKLVYPGETTIVTVRFLKQQPIKNYMKVGQKWFINEGARNVGAGEILEVYSKPL